MNVSGLVKSAALAACCAIGLGFAPVSSADGISIGYSNGGHWNGNSRSHYSVGLSFGSPSYYGSYGNYRGRYSYAPRRGYYAPTYYSYSAPYDRDSYYNSSYSYDDGYYGDNYYNDGDYNDSYYSSGYSGDRYYNSGYSRPRVSYNFSYYGNSGRDRDWRRDRGNYRNDWRHGWSDRDHDRGNRGDRDHDNDHDGDRDHDWPGHR